MNFPEAEVTELSPRHTIIRVETLAHGIYLCHGRVHPSAAVWMDIDGLHNRHPKQSIRDASRRMLGLTPMPPDAIPEMLALSINYQQAADSVIALRQIAPDSSIYFLTARVDGYQAHPLSRRSAVFRWAAKLGGQEAGFNWKQELIDAILEADPTLESEIAAHSIAPDMFPHFMKYVNETQGTRRLAVVTNFHKDGVFEGEVLPITWGDKTIWQVGKSYVPEALAALVAGSPELLIFDDKERSLVPIVTALPDDIRITQFVIGRYSHTEKIPRAIPLT